jgi:hypothetical protein
MVAMTIPTAAVTVAGLIARFLVEAIEVLLFDEALLMRMRSDHRF